MRSRRAVSVAGQDAQVVGLQDRIDRGEERRRLAGLAASTATAVTVAATGVVGLGAAVDRGGAERRVLVALAIAAAARKHALCLPRAADVGAAGVAALRACGGLGQVQHCFARAVIDGDVLGLDRAAVPAGGAAGAADRRPDRGFGVAGHGHVAHAPAVHGRLQVVARVGPDPGVVRAGAAGLREAGAGETADLRPDRPLRTRSVRAFQVHRLAGIAPGAGAAWPAGGAAGGEQRRPGRGLGGAGHGHVAHAPAVHGRLQVVARVGPDPGVVRAGAAGLREAGAGETADLRPDRPLRTRSVRAFQVHRLAGIAAVAGGDVARRAALADVEADRAGIEIAVAGVAQIAQAALQVAAQAGLLVFDLETDGLRVGAAEGDEIDACLLPAPADADHHAVAL